MKNVSSKKFPKSGSIKGLRDEFDEIIENEDEDDYDDEDEDRKEESDNEAIGEVSLNSSQRKLVKKQRTMSNARQNPDLLFLG